MGSLDQILKFCLPTELSRAIAVSSISLGLLAIGLPEFLLKLGVRFQDPTTLLIRIATPLTLWILGSLTVLILVLRVLTKERETMAQFETKITNEQFASKELKAENDRVRAQLDTEHQAYQAELQKTRFGIEPTAPKNRRA